MSVLDELFAYVGFDEDDRTRLRALHPILEPHFPAIAERFYEAVQASPGASAVLHGPEQIERLRVTLIDWMATGLLGPHDERFYEKRSRIGRRHVAIGLPHDYMFTAMSVVRIAYLDLIAQLVPDESVAIARSVNKLLDIELAVMARHYHLDSREKLVAREQRIQADRITAMRTMSAGLAHEVRNPLHAAKLQLELLERRLRKHGDDPSLQSPSQLAQKEIERVTLLLNDFLTFARPAELHAEERDVVGIVRNVVELERVSADRRGAELALIAPKQLIARVDSPKLHQVTLNLVRNALEAVSPGGHVSVELAGRDESFELRVKDDGGGIPDEIRARIYEPFFSTKEGGTGLGMSIVHSLVTLHGGTISIVTGSDGTCFDVAIPRGV
ncbi:MAG TPA: HAMP domain-containing sensor histidine kinase [Kofleriaceae bacterium]